MKTNELTEEAKDAFYKWEKGKDMGLSDNDRIIWMQGYVYAKQEEGYTFKDLFNEGEESK